MSALRLLAFSYLASASVFVVAATLVAHPQLAQGLASGAGALGRVVDEDVWQRLVGPREEDAVVRLTLAPFLPNDIRVLAHPHITAATATPGAGAGHPCHRDRAAISLHHHSARSAGRRSGQCGAQNTGARQTR